MDVLFQNYLKKDKNRKKKDSWKVLEKSTEKNLWRSTRITRVHITRNLDYKLPNSWSCIYIRLSSTSFTLPDCIALKRHTHLLAVSSTRLTDMSWKSDHSHSRSKGAWLTLDFCWKKIHVDEKRGTLKASSAWAEVHEHVSDRDHHSNVREDPPSSETQSWRKPV